ncbi:YbhB/YbcL family Raf kinase inhibitor-like protein [Nitrosopumilus ureiphilus]|uniref:YbhB/YbcL family Raf kinase inhibitor-like protein n=1 Tax=Nitrosopumilus ureiphilus TaxID=1470067 RepID=A0A7D5RHB8_9ARCH|nr:YbhB/YbcL family Raf kinase inhibitor-like protein [Nitrosopumilus ureiphilus]QLH07825.1 YbhB/YbcL family Raf kinase inhibitor-like protein [Nitrosopumilus ureiphilus]
MILKSTSFENGGTIPRKYGYKNENFSPPLIISQVPAETKSLVLIMDDPDAIKAVGKVWTHWVLWNIPPNIQQIAENSIPINSIEGKTDFDEIGYGGPAPPDKEHLYIFKLYALDIDLNLDQNSTKADVEESMKNHIISEAKLEGKYAP